MNLIINSIKSLYSSVKSNLEQLDWQTKRGIIKALVERIQIGYDQVEVAFRIEEPAQDGEIFNLQHCTGRHDMYNNVTKNNIIEFNRIIPRKPLHTKKSKMLLK